MHNSIWSSNKSQNHTPKCVLLAQKRTLCPQKDLFVCEWSLKLDFLTLRHPRIVNGSTELITWPKTENFFKGCSNAELPRILSSTQGVFILGWQIHSRRPSQVLGSTSLQFSVVWMLKYDNFSVFQMLKYDNLVGKLVWQTVALQNDVLIFVQKEFFCFLDVKV